MSTAFSETSKGVRESVPAWAGVGLCLLLAVAQVAMGGYQLGVGNQSIQIAFLKHWANPWMYASDAMVVETLGAYPSYFFRLLSPMLGVASLEGLYLVLQIGTSFATLACVYLLGRGVYRSHGSGLAAAVLLVPGHLQALAGDGLYSAGFTHTYAALPVAVGALGLAFRGRWVAAFAVAGVLFNLHALTAAYVVLMLAAGMFADRYERPADWLARAFLAGALFLALASPTLALMAGQRQVFDLEWVHLTRIRSADHSFPSSWWTAGDSDLPRFVLIFALFVMSWSFPALRRGWSGAGRVARVTVWMTVAVLGLFAVGYLFSEWYPVPLVIRLQPFRASRLLLVLMLVHIAHGGVEAIRGVFTKRAREGAGKAGRVVDGVAGVMVLGTFAVPSMLPLLPLTVFVVACAGLVAGHLSWRQSMVASGAFVFGVLAYLRIEFPIPFISAGVWTQAWSGAMAGSGLVAAALGCALSVAVLIALLEQAKLRAAVVLMALGMGSFLATRLFYRELREDPMSEQGRLAGVSKWAREKTPANAVFLTTAGLANFRISAERSLVGDWRDGTQIYFSAEYGPQWLDRVSDLEPGLSLSEDGTRLLRRGAPLASLDDMKLRDLANQYVASYILLPTDAERPRSLGVVYSDARFTVYEPRIEAAAVPEGVFYPQLWTESENFINTTVAQNIEKYRKADLTVQVLDTEGRPVQNLPIRLDQTKQAFIFGVSLGFFEGNNISPNGDFKPPPVLPVELEKAPEVFNGSMIPFSSKWQYIEPVKGEYHWSDLDKYVDYCTKNNMTVEFHHLSGILPNWVGQMGGSGDQEGLLFNKPLPAMQAEFDRHCLETVGRYADRVKYWQVVNEKYMMEYVPSIFKVLQEKYPGNKFGISDCVKFFGAGSGDVYGSGQYKGADAVDWLIGKGVRPDFFSVHGHRPVNLWPDPREMYRVFDYFQQRNVKVHVSEQFVQLGAPVYGPMRSGMMTPELQAEFLPQYLRVCFSNPNVEMVNIWGMAPNGWGYSGSGLMDEAGRTRPAWETLKKLFMETWHTHVSTELSLNGTVVKSVFHGEYKATVTLGDGRQVTAAFEVPQQPVVGVNLRLDAQKGTLEVVK